VGLQQQKDALPVGLGCLTLVALGLADPCLRPDPIPPSDMPVSRARHGAQLRGHKAGRMAARVLFACSGLQTKPFQAQRSHGRQSYLSTWKGTHSSQLTLTASGRSWRSLAGMECASPCVRASDGGRPCTASAMKGGAGQGRPRQLQGRDTLCSAITRVGGARAPEPCPPTNAVAANA
jgi:hypothetical protein